jgi:hypothetical protein
MKTIYQQKLAALKIQLCFTVLISTFFITSCSLNSDKTPVKTTNDSSVNSLEAVVSNDSINTVVNTIIDISAFDFYKNQKPLPIEFRNVQLKYNIKPNKEILYILCGEFATDDNKNNIDWTHFTTIKNSEYEQWIGPSGLTYCENSTEILYKKADLSIALTNRINSLKLTGN